jgi:hypothetical protein
VVVKIRQEIRFFYNTDYTQLALGHALATASG